MSALAACLTAVVLVAASSSLAADPAVGQPAPPLKLDRILQAPDGAVATWEALRGKAVVLEFWATWCGPCVAAIPHLNELAEQFKDQPVQFIAITAEEEDVVKPFLQKRPIRAWIGLDADKATSEAYEVTSIPRTILVDKKGRVAAVTHPAAVTPQVLEDLLAGRKISLPDTEGMAIRAGVLPGDKPQAGDDNALLRVVIRPSTGAGGSVWGSGKFTIAGASLKSIVAQAYDSPSYSTQWRTQVPETLFDVAIALPLKQANLVEPILQDLLREMFGVTGRREMQQRDVLLLSVPPGTKAALTPGVSRGSSVSSGSSMMQAVSITIPTFAANLAGQFSRPVIDETGIEGRYDFDLKWDPKDPEALAKAVREKYGLLLTSATRPVDVLIVEEAKAAATRPTATTQPVAGR
jgi:uncharacterized protein (TIGR03435 family)